MMNSTTSTNSIQVMFHHLPVLREYARRVILSGQTLDSSEEQDRVRRLEEFLATGLSLNWTPKEMAALLLREVFSGY